MRRVERSTAERSSRARVSLNFSTVVRRLPESAATFFKISTPSPASRLTSTGSREAMTSPGLSAGASGLPRLISTILSPSRPWVSIRATEFLRIRSPKRRAMESDTRTLAPGFSGSETRATRPICTPASRTVAPGVSPPTSVNSATSSYRGSK